MKDQQGMGKVRHIRIKQSEKDHEGWISGFMNLFDFRRGGSSHRLLTDKRFGNKIRGEGFSQDTNRSINSKYHFEYSQNEYENRESTSGPGKQKFKNFIDEEMEFEGRRKQNLNGSLEFVDFANDADANTLVREILIRLQKKGSGGIEHGQKVDFYAWPEMIRAKFVEQLTNATKVLLYEKLIGRVHVVLNGKIQYSREFIDALETLIYHKDLLFKLLEDPNSELTSRVNYMINSELHKSADQKESEALHHDKNNLFSKFRNAALEPLPETLSTSNSISSSGSGSKRKSYFNFTEIIRRFKHAMVKDKKDVYAKNELGRSISRRDSFGRMSPITNPHLEVEIHPKRLNTPERSDAVTMDLELTRLSFSMPYRSRSPSYPAIQLSIPTTHIRSTSQVLEQENSDNAFIERSDNSLVVEYCESDDKWSVQNESQGSSPQRSENIVFSDGEYEGNFSVESSIAAMTDADSDKEDAFDEDWTAPSPTISVDSDLVGDKTNNFNEVTSRVDNRPSPNSVLDPLCVKNEISPPKEKRLQGEVQVTPLQIHFEHDEDIFESDSDKSPSVKKSCDDNETKLNYLKEILIESGFSWDTFCIKYLSSDQLLDASLNEANVDTPNDKMLLVDLLNDVLEEACARYFGCSPCVSLSKPNIRPISDNENTIEEVLEEVHSHLNPSQHPQDVEDIATKDLYKDGRWTDFQLDVEAIGTDIADLILQELLVETALSCFSNADMPPDQVTITAQLDAQSGMLHTLGQHISAESLKCSGES